MLKFDEEKQLASVQGALALRPRIEDVVDGICKTGFRNLCWLGIGGTYASCLQAEVQLLPERLAGVGQILTNGAEAIYAGVQVLIQPFGHQSNCVDSSGNPVDRHV